MADGSREDTATDVPPDGEPASVLVVEDEQEVAEAYERTLSRRFVVSTAHNGKQALEQIDGTIDVVLLDRRMPVMSGDEVLEVVVERDKSPSVAMVSAIEPDDDILEMQFDEYATKPLQTDELEQLVEMLLARAEYDSAYRPLFRLLVKKTILENVNKDWTETYRTVCDELDTLQERLEDPDDELLPRNCPFH